MTVIRKTITEHQPAYLHSVFMGCCLLGKLRLCTVTKVARPLKMARHNVPKVNVVFQISRQPFDWLKCILNNTG